MNQNDYLNLLLSNEKALFNSYTVSLFNKKVTNLYLNGINEFDINMVVLLVSDIEFRKTPEQMKILNFVLAQVTNEYIPTLTKEFPYWAIDSSGSAYYYAQKPRMDEDFGEWRLLSAKFSEDLQFNPEKYAQMWEDGKWKTSLKELIEA